MPHNCICMAVQVHLYAVRKKVQAVRKNRTPVQVHLYAIQSHLYGRTSASVCRTIAPARPPKTLRDHAITQYLSLFRRISKELAARSTRQRHHASTATWRYDQADWPAFVER
jgi:hypothetical protein